MYLHGKGKSCSNVIKVKIKPTTVKKDHFNLDLKKMLKHF